MQQRKNILKFNISLPIIDQQGQAHLFIGVTGFYREACFTKKNQNWDPVEPWQDFISLHANQTEVDNKNLKEQIKRVLSKIVIDSPLRCEIVTDEEPVKIIYRHGYRYVFDQVLWSREVEDGLSFGYHFNDGIAISSEYHREFFDLAVARRHYARREKSETIDEVWNSLETTDIDELPPGVQVTVFERSANCKLIKINEQYFISSYTQSDYTQYISIVNGSSKLTIGPLTLAAYDTECAIGELLFAIARVTDTPAVAE